MNTVEEQIEIQATPEQTWAALTPLDRMKNYMPGIDSVEILSDADQGPGAARHCRFADGVELTERVVSWDEGKGYTLETTEFVGAPMRSNVITFRIEASEQGAVVTQSMTYAMKGWVFAPLMEKMAVGVMRKALRGALTGLKAHVEGG